MKKPALRALLVVVAALTLAAPAKAGWDDPVGKRKPVLVVPIRYADWSAPCSPAPCPSSFYDSTFSAAAGSINPPYRTAALWGTFLNAAVDDLLLEDSYGQTSFDFQPLVNPGTKSGWWDAGRPIEAYGRLASFLFPPETTTGLPAPLDDFVKRLPCSMFTSPAVHRLLFVDNLAIGGGLRGRQVITLQCGTSWEVDWSWIHQGGIEAGFLRYAERALGLGLGMRDVGRPCSAYPGRATCFEHWDTVAAAGNSEFGGLQRTSLGWLPSSSVKSIPLPATKSTTLDLQPLNAAPSTSTPTVVRLPIVSGPVFRGYQLECRRGSRVEKEGVLVTWVDDVGGQSWVASRSPLTLDRAALAPGEKLVDSKNDVEIQAAAATGSHCRAIVSEAPSFYSGIVIRIPLDPFEFLSPDVGLGLPGDLLQSPWSGHLNPLSFTVHNGGSGPTQNAHAIVSILHPATVAVACGPRPEGDPQNVSLPAIAAGQSRTTTLEWMAARPSAGPVRIAVHLEGGPGDRGGGGFAAGDYAVQTHTPRETTPVRTTFTIQASARCSGPVLFRSTPLRVPAGWSARVTPRVVRLTPGATRALTALVLAPRNARPGAGARIPIAVFASAGRERSSGRRPLQPRPAGGFDLFSRVVTAGSASLSCPAEGQVGSQLALNGTAAAAGAVLVEVRNPRGTPSVHEVQAGGNGTFTDSAVPDSAGTWRAQARFQGDAAHGPAQSAPCTVTVAALPPPAQSPDLVVNGLTKSSLTIANRGAGPARPFSVTVRPEQGGTTTFDVAGLAAGQSASRSFACLPGLVTVTADSGGTVAESNEGNNTATLLVQSCQ